MCGKFRALGSYRRKTSLSGDGGPPQSGDDEVVIYRVGAPLPVITFNPATGERQGEPMVWGWPERGNPFKYIHARAETVDERPTFKVAFMGAQRGVVIMRTFNEG